MNRVIVAGGVDAGVAGTRHLVDQAGSAALATARQLARFAAVVVCSVAALIEAIVRLPFIARAQQLYARARWLQRWCRVAIRILGLQVTTDGAPPRSGLLVSNHLSYLDIIVFSAVQPCVFVAKSDVASWPLFGWLARRAGTVFATRTRRTDCARAADEIQRVLAEGLLVVLFPEGTSSDGATVLPFKSALLEPAASGSVPVSVAAIRYSLEKGSVANEVCYWRDMTFVPHLWNLCSKQGITSSIHFARVCTIAGDRKQLARQLHVSVRMLLGFGLQYGAHEF